MNLVQINERLKDLPMQVVQQYANGMNPEVPPYLALGELQRREMSQKQMATAQGAQQGPQPSIKEQVEQKAGLMQLQQMQQQQMAQQMQQPRGPMPSSEGTPQPVDQPEVAMASGGLAAVPVRSDMFEYAEGGIIAFARGGEVDAAREEAKEALTKLRTYGLRQRQQDPEGYKAAEEAAAAAQERRRVIEASYAQEMKSSGVNRPATSMQDVGALRDVMQQPQAPANPADTMGLPAGLAAAAKTKAAPTGNVPPVGAQPATAPRPVAPRPAAQPPVAAGLPSALPQEAQAPTTVSPFMAEAATMAREKPVAPTPEGIIAEQNKLLPAAMQEDAMKRRMDDQRARAEQERAAFNSSRPSGLDDLIRVFGQSGQSKGLSGMAPAYTANIDRKRAEEQAMERRQNELMTAIEGREYEGAKELFGSRDKSMTAATKAFQDRLLTNTKTLADLAGVDQRRMDEALNRLSSEKLERLRIAARAAEANRPGEAERIEARYAGLIAQGKTQEAEDYLSRISKIKGGSGGDRNPTPTDRLRAAQSILTDIDSTPEEKATAKKEIAGIMSGSRPGGDGAPKVMTRADVLATAKSSGKTPQQVIEAAKARGFTIQ